MYFEENLLDLTKPLATMSWLAPGSDAQNFNTPILHTLSGDVVQPAVQGSAGPQSEVVSVPLARLSFLCVENGGPLKASDESGAGCMYNPLSFDNGAYSGRDKYYTSQYESPIDRLGRVTDKNGAGIKGIQLIVTSNAGSMTVTTDSNGYYQVPYKIFDFPYHSWHDIGDNKSSTDWWPNNTYSVVPASATSGLVTKPILFDGVPFNNGSGSAGWLNQSTNDSSNWGNSQYGGIPKEFIPGGGLPGPCDFCSNCYNMNTPPYAIQTGQDGSQAIATKLSPAVAKNSCGFITTNGFGWDKVRQWETANNGKWKSCWIWALRQAPPAQGPLTGNCDFKSIKPNPPTSCTAADTNNSIKLSWIDGANDETGFIINRTPIAGPSGTFSTVTAPILSGSGGIGIYIDSNVSCGTGYTYSVQTQKLDNLPGYQLSTPVTCIGTCEPIHPWFTAGGGDVTVIDQGQLGTKIPSGATQKFIGENPSSHIPGMAFGDKGVGWFGDPGFSANVSSTGWLVDFGAGGWDIVNKKPSNTYQAIKLRLQNKVVNVPQVNGSVGYESALNTAIAATDNKINSVSVINVLGDLETPAIGASVGSDKVIFLVDGSVTIKGELKRSADGFLAIFARDDIKVDGNVGINYSDSLDITQAVNLPNLEGIFYAGETFYATDPALSPSFSAKFLKINGTVIGMKGVNLQNRLLATKSGPNIYFNFQPDLTATLNSIGLRQKVFEELQAP